MIRPIPNNYVNDKGNIDWDAYRIAVELYNNEQDNKISRDRTLISKIYKELEKEQNLLIERFEKVVEEQEYYKKQLERYERALDKAITKITSCPNLEKMRNKCDSRCAKCWKEELLGHEK